MYLRHVNVVLFDTSFLNVITYIDQIVNMYLNSYNITRNRFRLIC